MAKKIILLRYNGRMDVPDEKDNRDTVVVAELVDLLRLNVIDYEGFHNDHGEMFDNQDEDTDSPLFEDETIFEVRLDVAIDFDATYDEAGHNVMKYVADQLDFLPAHISNCYDREYENFVKTVIEITAGKINDLQ